MSDSSVASRGSTGDVLRAAHPPERRERSRPVHPPDRSGARRARLATLEVSWYVVAFLVVVPGRSATLRPVLAVEYWVMVGLAAACAAGATARWRREHWTTPVALTVITLGVLVLVTRHLPPLVPLRLILSGAVVPILLAAVVRRGSRAVVAIAVALVSTGAALDTWRRGNTASVNVARSLAQGTPTHQMILLTALLFVLVPVVIGLLLRSTDATQRAERLARLRAEERLQVARELHDTVANHVTGILITAQAAAASTEESTRLRCVETIEDSGRRALSAMERMVGALRAPAGQWADAASAGLREEVPAWVSDPADAVRAAVGDDDRVRLRVAGGLAGGTDREGDAPDVLGTLHRITREAMTNARRYTSAGSTIDVELFAAAHAPTLVLRIDSDLSRRAAVVRGGRYGLLGLHERAAAVGGHLEAGPDGAGRWTVRAELPR